MIGFRAWNRPAILRSSHLLTSVCCLLLCQVSPAQSNNLQKIRADYQAAEQALNTNHLDVAEQEFTEILRMDPANPEIRANLGLVAFKRNDYATASKEFEAALKLKPDLWNAEAFWGICEDRLGNIALAQEHLERAFPHVQQKSLRTQVGLDLISILRKEGNVSKSVKLLEGLSQTDPRNAEVLYMAYRTYSDLAAHALSNLAAYAPGSARIHQILAQTLMNQNDYRRAIEEYQKALLIDPTLTELRFELGQAILANSVDKASRARAKKEFEAALAANPADPYSEYELGQIAFLDSDLEAAEQHYARAISLRPHFVSAQLGLAKVWIAQNQAGKALSCLLDAERSEPQNASVHYELATVYQKIGRGPEAERELDTFQNLRRSQDTKHSLFQEILANPPVPN
jgi:tetratricopeptide (TPR) repeat protein